MISRFFYLLLAVIILAGCASDPAPIEQLRLTEQALEQARAVGADQQVPQLALAEKKLRQAQLALTGGDFKQARVLAEQAELDARLAEARVLTAKSQEQLSAVTNQIERLRKQLGDVQ